MNKFIFSYTPLSALNLPLSVIKFKFSCLEKNSSNTKNFFFSNHNIYFRLLYSSISVSFLYFLIGAELSYTLSFFSFKSVMSNDVIYNCNTFPFLTLSVFSEKKKAKAVFLNPLSLRNEINKETKEKQVYIAGLIR